MKKQKISKQKEEVTAAGFEAAMARYAEAERREKEINSGIEEEVNDLLDRHKHELDCIGYTKSVSFGMVQAYCLLNKAALFAKRRSIGTTHGIAGFRLGTPRIKTAKGSSWSKVLQQLKEKLPDYVRANEEPAKALLLADRHKEAVAPLLAEIGIEIVQDELFYIETNIAA